MKKVVHKIMLLGSMLMVAIELIAKEVDQSVVPEARTWAEEYKTKSGNAAIVPQNILILDQVIENKPKDSKTKEEEPKSDADKSKSSKFAIKPFEFIYQQCQQFSYLECVNGVDVLYALKINKLPDNPDDKFLYKVAQANTILFSDGKFLIMKAIGLQSPKKIGEASMLNKSPDIRYLLESVLTSLGFDGVVLDIKDDYLLVGTIDSKLTQPEAQALVIRDSADRMVVGEGASKRGSALLGLVDQYNGYGVFKILALSKSRVPKIGQKVIIGKSKS